jgi:hypothetical protein
LTRAEYFHPRGLLADDSGERSCHHRQCRLSCETHQRAITGHPIPYTIGPRRVGDPAVLIVSSEKIRTELGWQPRFPTLDQIIGSAWEWHSRHPNGYAS